MRDLAAVADRLRLVRRAHRHFLHMWALDRAIDRLLVCEFPPTGGGDSARSGGWAAAGRFQCGDFSDDEG